MELPAAPIIIKADVEKLVRAIDNLMMNALKFSVKPGKINLKLAVNDEWANLSVENIGSPITKEQEDQLFERFYKVEASCSDRNMPPGSGLGLSITKHIAELHGGHIVLLHEEGRFTFSLGLRTNTHH
jgi:signal transduction histidine kinase